MLAEVARWVASRVRHTGRGYGIRRVQGIAEGGGPVGNNAFVNMSAAMALREAAAHAPALGFRANDVWTRIADDLVLPRSADGAIVNHDDYRPDEPKGSTPEAAAGLFPAGYPVDPETERRTLSAAVGNVDGYLGSPMLLALTGVYAARLGERDRALEPYERGCAEFVQQPHSVVTEYSPSVYPDQPRAGPFIANLGGFLYGLTGMTPREGDPAGWCRRPVTMPQGWDGVHVERLWVRGRPATLTAVHGEDRARLDLALPRTPWSQRRQEPHLTRVPKERPPEVERLEHLLADPDADAPEASADTPEWPRRWPTEEIWAARLRS